MAIIPDDDDLVAELRAAHARQAAYRAGVTPQQAVLAAVNYRAAPYLKPGDVTALARGGFTPDSPAAKQVQQARVIHKTRSGLGWHSVGDLISAGAKASKSALRVGFTTLAAPYEEGQGIVRNLSAESGAVGGAAGGAAVGAGVGAAIGAPFFGVGAAPAGAIGGLIGGVIGGVAGAFKDKDIQGNAKWESQSSLGIALGERLSGEKVDLGSGFLPGGEVRQEQSDRARNVQIGGHALTPGRLIAASIAEPGSQPYRMLSGLVDFSGALTADPANLVGGEVGKATRAGRMFTPEDVGGINALRRTVLPDRVTEFLDSDKGAQLVRGLTEDTSFDSIWRRSGKKLSVADSLALSKMTDPAEIRAYLDPKLGVTIREKPELGGLPWTNPSVRRIRDARLWQSMPGKFVDFDDPDQAVEQVDRFLRNANIRDPELISKHTTAVAEAAVSGNPADRYAAITAVADAVKDVIGSGGSKQLQQNAKQLTTMWRDHIQALTQYNIDDIGNNAWFPGVKVNGANQPAASPHLVVEALQSKVPLPDARDIRRATSPVGGILENPAIKVPTLLFEHLQQKIWKPMVLIRGAWPIRVVGEEQLRMAASGFDSFVNHPISALATVIGDDGRLAKLAEKTGVDVADKLRARSDLFGEAFTDAAVRSPDPTEFERALYQGRVSEPIGKARRVMFGNKVQYQQFEDGYARGWAGELMQLRTDPLAKRLIAGESADDVAAWLMNGSGRGLRDSLLTQGIDTSSGPATRQYVQTIVDRIDTKTKGLPDILDALRTGSFNGETMRVGDTINPKFVAALDAIKDSGPTVVKGDIMSSIQRGSELGERLDRATNWFFEQLMVKPSNMLSRSSTFRQSYWQRIEELIPFMDETTQQAAIRAGGEANLSRVQLRRMAKNALSARGTVSGLEQADMVAKAHALEATRDLLYDLADKGQFSDVMRMVMPFAEAWKEVITRWGKIVADRPNVVRRGQQLVEGARGAGWFHPDPTTGEEVFNYPGSELLTEHLLGVKTPFTGRVAGLSLATNVLPGFGPVVQLPASKIIPNTPDWDWAREAILPFGEQDTESGFVESFLPAWVQKMRTAWRGADPNRDRQFGNTVMDVTRYLVSTGEYSLDSPEAVERTLAAAQTKARLLYVLRGAAQFWAPSAPTPQFLAKDKDGHFMVAQKLVEDFRAMQEDEAAGGYDTAVERFLDRYGEQALLFMQPKTQGGPPSTSDLGDWARAHPTEVRRYKDVYAFFGPQGGDFDINFYGSQIRSGERKALKPEEAVKFANQRVASMAYRNAKAKLGDRTDIEGRLWLQNVREVLTSAYPGYDPLSYDDSRIPRLIRGMERAVEDDTLAGTDAGQAIRVYLSARERAQEAAEGLGVTGFQKSARTAYLRSWLRAVASNLIAEHPDFRSAWDSVFDRELVDDDAPILENVA